jgi:hypothetical protein
VTGWTLRASWPILHAELGTQALLAEACADLARVAYDADAVVAGDPAVWVDWQANRVRAEVAARPRRLRRREPDERRDAA